MPISGAGRSFDVPSVFGRESELAALLDAVDRVPATGVIAVLVSGEAGIGKSSLLGEAVRRLRAAKGQALVAESDDLGRHIPYATLAAMDLTEPGTFGRSCELVERLPADSGPITLVLDDLDHVDDDSPSLPAVLLRRLSEVCLSRVFGKPHVSSRLELARVLDSMP